LNRVGRLGAQLQEIVVVGISGRALAQSAARTGCRVVVLDVFADRDTQAVAQARCVGADQAIAVDPDKVIAALRDLDTPAERRAIVAGSGFERAPHWLSRMVEFGMLCANDADIIAALKAPELATELFAVLGWKVPETRHEAPADPSGWLQKEIGGAGGVHVRRAQATAVRPQTYYQREVPGRALSVTFLADGEQAWLLGFNALAVQAMGEAPFCYAGASTCRVEPAVARVVQAGLDRLVRVTGLRGLNGLDFLLDRGAVVALEINPRPTATFELYDPDYDEGLVSWHIRSMAGPLAGFSVATMRHPTRARACAVLYAEHGVCIPEDADFPHWCRDLPVGGQMIPSGAPVLSVFAEAEDEVAAQGLVRQRQGAARRMLERWQVPARQVSLA
jgi:predicted ATP-grasp superfamily ATP-dependent carboligase